MAKLKKYCYSFLLFNLLVGSSLGLLHDIVDIIDLSNVDLSQYEFFKNFDSQNPRTASKANPFIEHFQRKKAVLDYLEHLFFGLSPFTQESEIPFDPHFGRAWRPYYIRKFGFQGSRLIDMLGRGYSLQHLRKSGAIPKEFGLPKYPTR